MSTLLAEAFHVFLSLSRGIPTARIGILQCRVVGVDTTLDTRVMIPWPSKHWDCQLHGWCWRLLAL